MFPKRHILTEPGLLRVLVDMARMCDQPATLEWFESHLYALADSLANDPLASAGGWGMQMIAAEAARMATEVSTRDMIDF
jgi:hypothetical protein